MKSFFNFLKRTVRKAAFQLGIGSGPFVVTAKAGDLRLSVDSRDYVGKEIYSTGIWDRPETAYLNRLLKPGMTAVDVGAHIGYFTVLFASKVGPSGQVLAFEPEPYNFKLLRKNVRQNHFKNVRAFNCALGSKTGRARLFLSPYENYGDHCLFERESTRVSIPIKTAVFDEIALRCGIRRIDVVKMDVQGYERQVLSGMSRLLAASPQVTVLTEFWPYGLERNGNSAAEFFDFFLKKGFCAAVLREDGSEDPVTLDQALALLPPFNPQHTDSSFINLLFTKFGTS